MQNDNSTLANHGTIQSDDSLDSLTLDSSAANEEVSEDDVILKVKGKDPKAFNEILKLAED